MDIRKAILVKGKPDKKKGYEIDKRTEKSLNYSIAEGCFNSGSSSIINSFLIPFALSLGANNFIVGIIITLQNLGSTTSQIPGAMLTKYMNRKSIWLVSESFCRFLIWIPIFFIPFMERNIAFILLLLIVFFSYFFNSLRSPAWSSLMGDIVPQQIRGSYFGKRNTITGIAGIVVTLFCGYILGFVGFYVLFVLLILLGVLSIPVFLKMYEPPTGKIYHYRHRFHFDLQEAITSIKINKNLAIFTIYILAMNFAVEIASPFYIVYILKNLQIDYFTFSFLIILGTLARIFTYKYWGKINDRFGSRKTFIITGIFACFVPLGYILSTNAIMIAAVKIYDGVIFSGYDSIWFNYLLDITPADKRPQYVANHNFFAGFGAIFGGFIGGVLAMFFQNSVFLIFAGLQIIFLISFVLRLCSLSLLPKLEEVYTKQTEIVPLKYVFMETTINPAKEMVSTIQYTFMHPQEFRDFVMKKAKTIEYKIKINN